MEQVYHNLCAPPPSFTPLFSFTYPHLRSVLSHMMLVPCPHLACTTLKAGFQKAGANIYSVVTFGPSSCCDQTKAQQI